MDHVKDICFFYSDKAEYSAIAPVISSLLAAGYPVRTSSNIKESAYLGIYTGHSNLFYDFENHRWNTPNSKISIVTLHDLYQDGGAGAAYFENDSWHIFDYGFIPGPRWEEITRVSTAIGTNIPKYGFRVTGWPKADEYFKNMREAKNSAKKKILVAASWQGLRQVRDTIALLDDPNLEVTIKFAEMNLDAYSNSPWFQIIQAQALEALEAESLAAANLKLKVPSRESDIFDLISESDLVISNGSNVMFEAIVAGKAVISVLDWMHPSGAFGEENITPAIYFPGVRNVLAEDLSFAIAEAFRDQQREGITFGGYQLLHPENRGHSTDIFCQEVISIYSNELPEGKTETTHESLDRPLTSKKEQVQKALVKKRDAILEIQNRERDALVSERDALVSERDALVSERDALVSERDALVSERDALVSERDALVSERDALLGSYSWKLSKPVRQFIGFFR